MRFPKPVQASRKQRTRASAPPSRQTIHEFDERRPNHPEIIPSKNPTWPPNVTSPPKTVINPPRNVTNPPIYITNRPLYITRTKPPSRAHRPQLARDFSRSARKIPIRCNKAQTGIILRNCICNKIKPLTTKLAKAVPIHPKLFHVEQFASPT